jgi:hypothetical protein
VYVSSYVRMYILTHKHPCRACAVSKGQVCVWCACMCMFVRRCVYIPVIVHMPTCILMRAYIHTYMHVYMLTCMYLNESISCARIDTRTTNQKHNITDELHACVQPYHADNIVAVVSIRP